MPDFAGCMIQEDNSNEIFGYQGELYSLDTQTLKEMSKIQMCATFKLIFRRNNNDYYFSGIPYKINMYGNTPEISWQPNSLK